MVDSKIAAALLDAVTAAALEADASALASALHGGRVGHAGGDALLGRRCWPYTDVFSEEFELASDDGSLER